MLTELIPCVPRRAPGICVLLGVFWEHMLLGVRLGCLHIAGHALVMHDLLGMFLEAHAPRRALVGARSLECAPYACFASACASEHALLNACIWRSCFG